MAGERVEPMLSDERKIENLCFRYSEILDRGDHAALGQLFKDGEIECFSGSAAPAGLNIGAAAVKRFYDEAVVMHEGGPRTRHVISNLILEIEPGGTAASTRSYFHVFQDAPGVPLQVIASGRYHDAYRKVDADWIFKSKRIYVDLLGDVRQHSRTVHEGVA
jgi:hypothetical protein